ncbi:MAG: bifunctional tetrahydrofolate synthase/dihydrofolate synthase [Gammaproteobacteria bacterium]|nr:bifunctional tetrahydrofolate synthase/dihydrofolate synthase [Gammaproteobacteria bacterium]
MKDNLAIWLTYLESLPSGLSNLGLNRLELVAAKLQLKSLSSKVITVTGTNGKGSCVAFLEAILRAANLQVATFTSPHLFCFNERIRVNGINVDDATLCNAFTTIEQARGNISLSYFEFITLAALRIFQQIPLQVIVLEIGLGGRFDPVNIVDADIAVISSIGFDHTHILGNTRNAIGWEKAGIMRRHKPIVCGDDDPPSSVIAQATYLQAPFYRVGKDFSYKQNREAWNWNYLDKKSMQDLPLPRLSIINAATALMATELLQKYYLIPDIAIYQGIREAFLPGRMQHIKLNIGSKVIFDVAHNPQAAKLLAQNLSLLRKQGRILAVSSMLQDKDIVGTFSNLTALVDCWYIASLPSKRGATLEQLEISLEQSGAKQVNTFPDITLAFKQAIADCRKIDTILVFGSFHTVGICMKYFR